MLPLQFDNRALRELPVDPEPRNFRRFVRGACLSRVAPTPVGAPSVAAWVPEVAAMLGLPERLDTATEAAAAAVFSGNATLPGSEPFAWRYGGHQFGSWADQLGDGRAISLGEVHGPGGRFEVQLKGAGPTPYSRGGDGRAVLRSSLRELLCSEAMAHLGVPTTRALSLVTTGEPVVRDMFYDGNARPEPGAIVCRVAPSFVRVGHFEILAAHGEQQAHDALLDHVVRHHFPALAALPRREAALGLLREVCRRSAELVIHWQRVGFVHGVLNTDNLSILGLTIDYGPYGWLDTWDPGWTPNTTDAHGRRYRFGAQPQVVLWNLVQLANALYPAVPDVPALEAALEVYEAVMTPGLEAMFRGKLGLPGPGQDGTEEEEDAALVLGLGEAMSAAETDPTLLYRALAGMVAVPEAGSGRDGAEGDADDAALWGVIEPALYDAEATRRDHGERWLGWLRRYRARLRRLGRQDDERAAAMNAVNPVVIPRNFLAQEAIDAAEQGDFAPLHALLDACRRPYEEPANSAFARKRPEWARSRPGCSMLSCSS
ncbi:MAG: YdiU family protein [Deltaproteobacteria bacterium]|nr:YdiU family protein [Deltaproteobacteria bacterium]